MKSLYELDDRKIWFRKTRSGNYTLVREDGTYRAMKKKNSQFFLEVGGQANEGWKRSMLIAEEFEIWDATAFGATMSAVVVLPVECDNGYWYGLFFISCETAERYIYQSLPKEVVEDCRKNVDKFYGNKDAQLKCQSIILHPVCIKVVQGDKNFYPFDLTELVDGIDQINGELFPYNEPFDMKDIQKWLFGAK